MFHSRHNRKDKDDDDEETFKVIWDSGASLTVTPDERDFAGKIDTTAKSVGPSLASSKELPSEDKAPSFGETDDVAGNPRIIKTPGYWVPKGQDAAAIHQRSHTGLQG